MSHLKLQKLLFYCDAYHLAYFGEELINDNFEAWMHGPVCRRVFDELKGSSALYSDVGYENKKGKKDPMIEFKKLTSIQQELITDILEQLSTWTGTELEAATHNETPWKEAHKGYGVADRCTELISKNTTREFYKKDLNEFYYKAEEEN